MGIRVTAGDGVIPAAALQLQPDLEPSPLSDADLARLFEKDLASQAITKIEDALGGRGRLTEDLITSPELTPSIRYVLTLVFDPRYDHLPLGKLCQMAGITPGEFFRAFRDAKLAKASVKAMSAIADGLVPIAQELVRDAVSHQETCPLCAGTKTILVRDRQHRLKKKAKLNGEDGDAAPGEKNVRIPCTQCLGVGQIHVRGGLEEKKLALELAGLLRKGPGIVVQQNTQHNQQNNLSIAGEDGAGGLGALQQAVSLIMQSPRPQPPQQSAQSAQSAQSSASSSSSSASASAEPEVVDATLTEVG